MRRSRLDSNFSPEEICYWKTNWQRLNPDRNLDRSDANDGNGASGATDILPRDDSGGSRKRRNSKVCLAGIRGLRKRGPHLLWTR